MKKNNSILKIDEKALRIVEGLSICLLAIFLALNYGKVSQFFFWIVSFFAGSLFTYFFYIILFVFGLTFIFDKKITLNNLKFFIIGLSILSLGVLIISTCSISYLENGDYLTFPTFGDVFITSLNLANFPKIEINQSGGLFGYLFVAILNTAFTDLGTQIFSGILIGVGTFFMIFRPFVSLIRSHKEIKLKPSENLKAFSEINDENLLTENSLERDGNDEYIPTFNNTSFEMSKENIEEIKKEEPVKVEEAPVIMEESKKEEVKEEINETIKVPILNETKEKEEKSFVYQTNGLQKVVISFEGEEKPKQEVKPQIKEERFYQNEEPRFNSYETNKINNNYVAEEEPIEEEIEENVIEESEPIVTAPSYQERRYEEVRPQFNAKPETKVVEEVKPKPKKKASVKFIPVPTDFLNEGTNEKIDQKNIEVCDANLLKINEILTDLKIGAKIVSYQIGPSVTRYDLETDKGVSISGFDRYINDISIKLGGMEARFVPLIQGKTTSGIEIANEHRSTVYFKDVFTHLPPKKPGQFYIPFGKNISGDYIHADLAEFPHMLVCGTTGSGKSIFMHSMILSLIMRSSVDELRLVMIDPKRVEFNKYRDSPHLLCPVISEPTEASATLTRLADEMEERFNLFQDYDVSNIKQYNQYAKENNLETIPYIVLVVDEFADLIDSCKTVAQPIQKLGAKARAAGIHMIIATQRPSTDVITGTIKANLSVRVALMTSSSVDSVVALGEGGAEKLLGYGDMLVSCALISKQEKVRVQGCLVENSEITQAVKFLKDRYPLEYNEKFLNLLEKSRMSANDFGTMHPENFDESKYQEIKKYIMEYKDTCSISMIQRECSCGFSKSSKFFNRLIEEGIIEKAANSNSSKGAKVLIHIGTFKSQEEQTGNPGTYSQSTFEPK